MANILRIVILRPNYVGPTAGILQASLGIQQSFSVIPNLAYHSFSNTGIKYTIVKSFPRHCSTSNHKKSELSFKLSELGLYTHKKRPSKFEELHLHLLKPSEATEGILVNSFLRIIKIYYNNVYHPNFKKQFREFVASKQFKDFCTMLENKLPQFSPPSLISLLDLRLFDVPPTSRLMQKVLALILENFNDFTLSEKVFLYIRLSEKDLTDFKEYKAIKKVCDVYFEASFENDLYYMKYSHKLLRFMQLEVLPEKVRKLIVKKLVDDAFIQHFSTRDICTLVETISGLSSDLLPRNDVLRLIKKRLFYGGGKLLINSVGSYVKLLQNDESFYDEEVIDLVTALCRRQHCSKVVVVTLTMDLILMGHIVDDLIQKLITYVLSSGTTSLSKGLLLTFSSVLVRTSYQKGKEMDPEVKNIRKLLESIDPFGKGFSFSDLCTYCELLTYMGCDTRDWCSRIFNSVNEGCTNISEGVDPQTKDSETDKKDPFNVLLLHHLAKACLSSGFLSLSDKMLHKMVGDELKEMKAFSLDDVNGYFGGEDYVLKGCTTPDKHCLHFVSLFGPNNKPIKLSEYIKRQKTMSDKRAFNIAEIERPVGSKMIAFQVFTDGQPIKFRNEPRMSGVAEMYLKMFESLDCHVVLLPLKFFKLPPKAKEEFLESQINEIIEKSEISESEMMGQ